MNKLTESRIANRNLAPKIALDKLPLPFCEDVSPHFESTNNPTVGKRLNAFPSNSRNRRVCARDGRVENLVEVESRTEKWAAGATNDIKGALVNYEAKLILKGLSAKTILDRIRMLQLIVSRGANLLNPESIFHTINNLKKLGPSTETVTETPWTPGSKNYAAKTYVNFCKVAGVEVPDHINFKKWAKQKGKLPWIPHEKEVDALIACCSRKVGTFLQLLKETGMRCGEAWRLTWSDVDPEHNIISCNHPEKGSNPRQFKVSSKLVAMLNQLPKIGQKVFGESKLNQFRQNFMVQRKKASHKLQNPRLQKISFHTLRHFYGTILYHKTKDILHVKQKLGHQNINSTLIYTHLVSFDMENYTSRTAKTTKEASQLVEAGFEYVCTTPQNVMLFRKRK